MASFVGPAGTPVDRFLSCGGNGPQAYLSIARIKFLRLRYPLI